MGRRRKPERPRAEDEVTEAGMESFPASDPPAYNARGSDKPEEAPREEQGERRRQRPDRPRAADRPAGDDPGSQEAREFERLLRDRYEALWADIQRELEKYRVEQYGHIVERAADPADRAVGDLLVNLNIAEINRDVDELRAVQRALERIRRGTYGRCAACGEPIARARLKALPQVDLCLECQQREETKRGTSSPSL